ncbi:MAG: cytidine deaminase [Candidatus Kariarchaeaceae archaeon]
MKYRKDLLVEVRACRNKYDGDNSCIPVDQFTIKRLMKEAKIARSQAHAPYSGFKVGAALLTSSDRIFQGCNIENISFSLTNCAERTAIFSAIAQGEKEFTAMSVVTDDDNLSSPCGGCLQVLSEFVGIEFPIILANLAGKQENLMLKDFLPRPFAPSNTIGAGNE